MESVQANKLVRNAVCVALVSSHLLSVLVASQLLVLIQLIQLVASNLSPQLSGSSNKCCKSLGLALAANLILNFVVALEMLVVACVLAPKYSVDLVRSWLPADLVPPIPNL